jgi:hypothetical protein
MTWLSWLIDLFRAWRGDPAETEEHVGQVIQQNADLIARNARDEAALKADANGPRWLTPMRWISVAGGVALSADCRILHSMEFTPPGESD